jgi:hypothetical protein
MAPIPAFMAGSMLWLRYLIRVATAVGCQLETCEFKSCDCRRPSAAKLGADAAGTLGRRARNAV